MLVLFYSYIDSIVVFDSYTTFREKKIWAEYPGAISWRRHCPRRLHLPIRPRPVRVAAVRRAGPLPGPEGGARPRPSRRELAARILRPWRRRLAERRAEAV